MSERMRDMRRARCACLMAGVSYSVRLSGSCHVCCKPQVPHPSLLRRHLSALLRDFLSAPEAQTEHISGLTATQAARQPFYSSHSPRGPAKGPAAQAVIQLSHIQPDAYTMPAIIDKITGALHLNKHRDEQHAESSTSSAPQVEDKPKAPVYDKDKVTVLFVLGGPGAGT